jgi:RNA polymerase sigma-70 factor (ECF subfamily)
MDNAEPLAFEVVHQRYEKAVYRLILRLVGNRDDAEDLTVETFVNAYRNWDRIQDKSKAPTLLYQIAVNNCKNRYKARGQKFPYLLQWSDGLEPEFPDA